MKLRTVVLVLGIAVVVGVLLTNNPVDPLAGMSPTLRAWYDQGDYYNYHGFAIFYKTSFPPNSEKKPDTDTELPVLLLIHGFPSSSYDYFFMWEKLSRNFRLVTFDMLGAGFSDKPHPHGYSLVAQADLVEALMVQKLELSSFHVLGHDTGVSVAQELLARQQEGTNKTDILSTAFLNGGLFPVVYRRVTAQHILSHPIIGPPISRNLPYSLFIRSLEEVFGDKTANFDEFAKDVYYLNVYKYGLHIVTSVMSYLKEREDRQERWVGALKWAHIVNTTTGGVNVPAYVINGPSDPISGKHLYDHYMKTLPNAQGTLLGPGVGHFPLVQTPGESADAFLNFHRKLKNL